MGKIITMKSFVIAALFASTNAVKLEWPSVARCNPGQISTDSWPCDDNSKGPHHLDGTQVQIDSSDVALFNLDGARIQTNEAWPSVARCNPGQISTDSWPCDDNSKGPHHLDGTQLQLEYRPPIKCKDPSTGNPISCDWNDIDESNSAPLPKKGGLIEGHTPVKEVFGGPNFDQVAKTKAAKEAAEAKAK